MRGKKMKISKCLFMLGLFLVQCPFQKANADITKKGNDPQNTDDRVTALLGKMSLEEKVGQMTQITLEAVVQDPSADSAHLAIDPRKLNDALVVHHIGSVLNVVTSALSVDHWHEIITQIQNLAIQKSDNHIPVIYGIDAIHGATYTLGSTLFPQSIAMAATWNQNLIKEAAAVTALEIRASGIPWNFSPVLDIGRQPLWARFWETYGEDVYLASALGKSYINGLQGSDLSSPTHAAACLKHYLGYSYPLSGKDRTPAWISERVLREYFLPSFEAGIAAGAPSIMINSSSIDGIPVHSNYHLLTEILRGELHFTGFTVSDWEDIKRLYTRDKVASSPEAAVKMAVMAGVDMSMVPMDFTFYDILVNLVKTNQVPMSRIDEAVSRILRVKFELGLFENAYPDTGLKDQIAKADSTALNLQAAEEAITLLKNKNKVLPLSKDAKIFVTGPTANSLSAINGGWTITWQGDDERLYPQDKLTILKAIQSKVGADQVTYLPGATFHTQLDIQAAVQAAQASDVTVICLGEKPYTETAGNIDDLTLDDAQLVLTEQIIKTGKPVILVMVEGRPRVINRIVDGVSGILMAYLPGMEGGRAISNILFGDANPSGKLPFSYPKHPNSIVPYDHLNMEEAAGNVYEPQYPFGFGLSYTDFEYTDLKLSTDQLTSGQSVSASVTVKNIGGVPGRESVQLYLNQSYASVARPVRQIKGFTKVNLAPGEAREVTLTLLPSDLSFIGRDNKRVIESGEFHVMIGGMEKKFILK
jgi:beta-glucosidase